MPRKSTPGPAPSTPARRARLLWKEMIDSYLKEFLRGNLALDWVTACSTTGGRRDLTRRFADFLTVSARKKEGDDVHDD